MLEYPWPVTTPYITDVFHSPRILNGVTWLHAGTDFIDLINDDRIFCVKSGIVIAEGYETSMGYHIVVRSDDSVQIRYLHFRARSNYRIGNSVQQGQVVGLMGTTGFSSGKHLHIDASCATIPQALAELATYGVDAATAGWNIHWRLNQAFFNLQLVFGRLYPVPVVSVQESDMRVFKTIDAGKTSNYYVVGAGFKRHINDGMEVEMQLRACQQAAAENCFQAQMDTFDNLEDIIRKQVRAVTAQGLIKGPNSAKTYQMTLGLKRWIENPAIFNAGGYDIGEIATISDTDLNAVEDIEDFIRNIVRTELDRP